MQRQAADYGAVGLATLSVRARRDNEDDHRLGQRRPARRGRRDLHGRAVQRRQRDARRRPRASARSRDDDPLSASDGQRRRTRDRGQRRHGGRHVHGHAWRRSSGRTVTVDYATANGSATAASDYAAATGTLTFAPGRDDEDSDRARQRRPARRGERDLLPQPHERRRTRRSPTPQGIGTIIDDDGQPAALDRRRHRDRGQLGSRQRGVLPSRSRRRVARSSQSLTRRTTAVRRLRRTTASQTAPSSSAPGQTTQTIKVPVLGDTLDEVDESFTVTLSAPATQRSQTTRPGDDHGQRRRRLRSRSATSTVTEGTRGRRPRRSPRAWAPRAESPCPSITPLRTDRPTTPADYAATSGTLGFAAGQTTKPVTVNVNGDALDESNETFDGQPCEPIERDDRRFRRGGDDHGQRLDADAGHNDATVIEGNAPATVDAKFTVSLSAPSGQTVTVQVATANNSAVAPADYTALKPAKLTFDPGETTKQVERHGQR